MISMLPEGLLELVKNRRDITWTDSSTDGKLEVIISNGIADLDRINGRKNEYTQAGKAQRLLFAYVMYDLADCLDDFWVNYRSDIISFINEAKVKAYVESQSAESS